MDAMRPHQWCRLRKSASKYRAADTLKESKDPGNRGELNIVLFYNNVEVTKNSRYFYTASRFELAGIAVYRPHSETEVSKPIFGEGGFSIKSLESSLWFLFVRRH